MNRKLETSKGESDALRKVKNDMDAIIKKIKSDLDQVLNERRELIDQINDLKRYNDDVSNNNRGKNDILEKLKAEISVLRAKEHQFVLQINSLKQNLNEEKDQLIEARAKLSEWSKLLKDYQELIISKEALLKIYYNSEDASSHKINELQLIIAEKELLIENLIREKQNIESQYDPNGIRDLLEMKREYENYKSKNENQNRKIDEKINDVIKLIMKAQIQCKDLEKQTQLFPSSDERRFLNIGVLNNEILERLDYLYEHTENLCKEKILLVNEWITLSKGKNLNQELFDTIHQENKDIELKLTESENKIEDLNHELLLAKRKLKQSENNNEKKDSLISSLKETISKLEEDLGDQIIQNDKLIQDANHKSKEYEPLRIKLNSKVGKIKNLRSEIYSFNSSILSLKEELGVTKTTLNNRNADVISLNMKIRSLNEIISNEQKSNAQLQKELALKTADLAVLNNRKQSKPGNVLGNTSELLDRIEYLKDELGRYNPNN